MNKRTFTQFMAAGLLSLICFGQLQAQELKHSYVFTDEGVVDTVGGANGTLVGGSIADGVYTASTAGDYIELPAADIAIYDYTAITLEARVVTSAGLNTSGYTVISYFGDTYGDYGNDGYLMSIARPAESTSKTSMYIGNDDAPWENEEGVSGEQYDDGAEHHIVSMVTDSDISLYIDGSLVGTHTFEVVNNQISGIGTSYAWLCKGGYSGNPTWLGTIKEFNIYEGAFTADSIAYLAQGATTAVSEKMLQDEVNVYPSPVQGTAHLALNLSKSATVNYAIYNITGQKMDEKSLELAEGAQEIAINTNDFAAGIYVYKVQIGENLSSGKFSVIK